MIFGQQNGMISLDSVSSLIVDTHFLPSNMAEKVEVP